MNVGRTYFAWAIAALFYSYQYVLRVLPANIEPELRGEFQLTAQEFGSMGSLTIYAYALMQIPVGILIDRVGVKRVILASLGLCVAGAFLMSVAPDLGALQMSRFLIGVGSASAFTSAVKIAADYLPLGRRGLLIGATLTVGTVGAIVTGTYLVSWIEMTGWRSLSQSLAILGLLVIILAVAAIRLKPISAESRPFKWGELWGVFKSRSVMTYAVLAIGVYTPLAVLADLWGPAFLMEKFHLSKIDATSSITLLYVGLSIGSLILPPICERYGVLERAIQVSTFAILALFTLLLFGPVFSIATLQMTLLLIGIFCGSEMICFTGAVQSTSALNSGITLGVVNTLNMLGGAMLQQGIGYVLDWQWTGLVDPSGVRMYSAHQFVVALSLLLSVIALCCVLSLTLRRKFING
ncbi:MAG: MFS transporter [Deltaproteobacteria bacterium]|nr:MFS transporter [Deltaproteobacteria bacterium]